MKPIIYTANDYASIDTGKISVYYGEREADPVSGEWSFVVWKNNPNGLQKEVLRVSNSQLLDIASGEGPKDMLIAGLSLWLAK